MTRIFSKCMHILHIIIISNTSIPYLCSDSGQSAKLLEDVRYLAEAHGTHMDAGHQPNTNTNATPRPEEASDSTTHEHPSPDASSSSSGSVWRPSLFPVGPGNGNDAASTDSSGLAKIEPKDIYCGECSDAFMHDPPRSSSAARRMKVRESDQRPLDFTLNFDTVNICSDSGNSRSNGTSNTSSSSSSSSSSGSSSSSSSSSNDSSSSSSRSDKGRDATSYSGTTGDRMKSKSMGCSRCGNCTEEADASGKAPFPTRDPPQDPPSRGQTDQAQMHLSRADRVMMNFRELLWYWREYYLRRGRDRLSIEFSSHIPFFQWSLLVGVYVFLHLHYTHEFIFCSLYFAVH
jgi:hypothetical protein